MLPNLIVIGGAKCGSSSLHYYLGLHPEIFMSRVKELNFFIAEKNWPKGRAWYEAQFQTSREAEIRGETSPEYTRFPIFRGVSQRMHDLVPETRLIYILRDPLERLISHCIDDLWDQGADQPIDAALARFDGNPFIMPSLQCLQLEQYLTHFPLSHILLITAEDLARKRHKTLARVFRFLGVDATFRSANFALELNPRAIKRDRNAAGKLLKQLLTKPPGRSLPSRIHLLGFVPYHLRLPIRHWLLRRFSRPIDRPVLAPGLERQLLDLFHDDVERLRRATGLKLEGWCV